MRLFSLIIISLSVFITGCVTEKPVQQQPVKSNPLRKYEITPQEQEKYSELSNEIEQHNMSEKEPESKGHRSNIAADQLSGRYAEANGNTENAPAANQ
jgi:hypothetical protein